jgi:hypothetical protein
VDDDFQNVPGEIAARVDRRGVMLEAAAHVEALHHATTRLGDALVGAGLSGREWRSQDALLSLLDEELPDVTVDALITRLAEFAADTGPVWLHGDERDLEEFHREVEVLNDVARPLRRVAHRLRMGTAGRDAELPIERAFASVRVATPLDLLAAILRDLEMLAPIMAPLAPEEWEAPLENARMGAASPPWADVTDAALAAVNTKAARRGRQSAVAGRSMGEWLQDARAALARGGREVGAWARAHRLVATASLCVALIAAIGLVELVAQAATPRASALIAAPAQVTLICGARPTPVTITLRNPSQHVLAWQATPPSGVSLAPARGTLKPGQRVALRVSAVGKHPGAGTMVVTAGDGTLTIAYTIRCR